MNDHNQNRDFCYYHPQQAPLVGVCPFCLNEKLLVVEANQGRRNRLLRRRSRQEESGGRKAAGNIVGLPKMLALGSFLNRLELRRRRRSRRPSYGCDDGGSDHSQSTSTSLEDSFISIKFEENGVALWDNMSKVGKASQDHLGLTEEGLGRSGSNRSVVEHPKAARESLRWRKRIGHFLQLVKWKRSNKGSGGASRVDGVGGVVKVRSKSWIRALTKRTNQE